MENKNPIGRITDTNVGPLDGVTFQANAVITKFRTDKGGKKEIDTLETVGCKLMASYQTGTASVSIPDKQMMVSVRLDEMMLLLAAAASASKETDGKKLDSPTDYPLDSPRDGTIGEGT